LQPERMPAVVHADGTSRVQTVTKEQHPGLYEVLSNWYIMTGIPVLLNTSLNIKGQPLLNDHNDIMKWQETYKSKIIGGFNEQ
jgi:carbamoyltransferase